MVGRQELTVAVKPEEYSSKIAPARTFGFAREVEALRSRGLARGGSLQNAVVLDETGILSGPLRFRDEFVRHKVLDLIGDLALLGRQVLGTVIADRAGHAMHTALVSRIMRDGSLWEETTLDDAANQKSDSAEIAMQPVV